MKNHSLLFKFFLGFILFLTVPLIIAGYSFNYFMMRYSEDEISKSNAGKLKIIRNMNEMLVEELRNDVLRLSLSNSLYDIINLKEYESTYKNVDNVIRISRAMDSLYEITRTDSKLHSVYLYPEKADYVLTTDQGVVLKKDFLDSAWLEDYRNTRGGQERVIWLKTRSLMDGQRIITYIFPLNSYVINLDGALVINLHEDAICRLINNNNFENEGRIMIFNSEGSIISSVDKSLIGTNVSAMEDLKGILESEYPEGHLLGGSGREKELISYYKSDLNQWIYVGIYSLDKLGEKAAGLRILIIYIVSGIIIIGLLTSYLLSRRFYSPVNDLMQEIKTQKGLVILKNENEMDIVSKTFNSLLKNESQMRDEIEKNKKSVSDQYLINLLNGNHKGGENPTSGRIRIDQQEYITVVISIDRYQKFDQDYSREQQHYLKSLVLNHTEEIIFSSFNCAGVVLERDRIALIISLKPAEAVDYRNGLMDNFQRVQNEIKSVMENTVTVAAGGKYSDKDGIRVSYLEAQNTLRRRLISGYGSIIFADDFRTDRTGYYYPFQEEKCIINCVSLGLEKEMENALDEFFDKLKKDRTIPIDNIIQSINQLLGSAIKYLVDSNVNVVEIMETDMDMYGQIAKIETLKETVQWFKNLFMRIIRYMGAEDRSHIGIIMDYIHANYHRDIDINALADYANLSYSYIRKVFKNETGKSIVDYINNLRIDEAKKLLDGTEENIVEIALKLGYNNDQSFTRFFKKYEGITPGEYRRSSRGM